MSPDSVSFVFLATSEFEEDILAKYVKEWNGATKKTTNKYQRFFWSVNGLSVILYSKKLVVQGRLTEFTKRFIRGLRGVKGLTLDSKNAEKFMKLFPVRQSSIICSKCGKDSLLVKGYVEGLDILFGMECGHKCNLVAPFLTLNNRVLPDINVICAKSVSRLVNLGYLIGVEIIFPEFILDVIDKFKGSRLKKAVSGELDNLRKIEERGLIKINTFSNLPIKIQHEEDEDKIILDFARFTNSILLTSDEVFKERALMLGHPTIFISPDDFGKLKMIEEVRT